MKFVLEVSLDDADMSSNPKRGLVRVLAKVADSLRFGHDEIDVDDGEFIRDVNGNCIGKWVVKEE